MLSAGLWTPRKLSVQIAAGLITTNGFSIYAPTSWVVVRDVVVWCPDGSVGGTGTTVALGIKFGGGSAPHSQFVAAITYASLNGGQAFGAGAFGPVTETCPLGPAPTSREMQFFSDSGTAQGNFEVRWLERKAAW